MIQWPTVVLVGVALGLGGAVLLIGLQQLGLHIPGLVAAGVLGGVGGGVAAYLVRAKPRNPQT